MFAKGSRPEPRPEYIEGMDRAVGPETYSPKIDFILKTGTSKPMLERKFPPERHLDPNEPGPGHYTLPDSFNISDPKKPFAKTQSLKKEGEDDVPGPGRYNLPESFQPAEIAQKTKHDYVMELKSLPHA